MNNPSLYLIFLNIEKQVLRRNDGDEGLSYWIKEISVCVDLLLADLFAH